MRAKTAFVIGAGVGYVLGTRAGRQQYEKIARWSRAAWQHPLVHTPVSSLESRASELARAQSLAMIDHLAEAAKSLLRHDVVTAPPAATASSTVPAGSTGTADPTRRSGTEPRV